MGQRFVIAYPHFGHKGMIMFSKADGTPARPWGRVCDDMEPAEAERVAAMDAAMVERWNAVVHPKDTVEVLGDGKSRRLHQEALSGLSPVLLDHRSLQGHAEGRDHRVTYSNPYLPA
jgi:hypothetical protein